MYETNHSPAPVLKFIRNGRACTGFGAILLAGVLMASALTACAPAGQRRSAGTVLDDQTYETRAIDVLFSRDEFGTNDHIKVEVHNATLLMAGETQSEANKQLATELTSQLRGIKRVVNELEVMPPSTAAERLNNSYMTSKVNSVLTTKNPVAGFDATRIKVLTARNIVYLMGTVTRAEGDAVTEVVRNIGGVSRVVKVFDYTD
jgi:osmotically-inducible protein OsmY